MGWLGGLLPILGIQGNAGREITVDRGIMNELSLARSIVVFGIESSKTTNVPAGAPSK